MTAATRDEIIAAFRSSLGTDRHGRDRVSVEARNAVSGALPGHCYFTPGRPTDDEMAAITAATQPHNLEVALLRINGHHCLMVGIAAQSSVNIRVPERQDADADAAIVSFQFIALTHPRDHPSFRRPGSGERFHAEPTPSDLVQFAAIDRSWPGQQTYVIVCHGGRAEGRIPFRPPETSRRFAPGRTTRAEEDAFDALRRRR